MDSVEGKQQYSYIAYDDTDRDTDRDSKYADDGDGKYSDGKGAGGAGQGAGAGSGDGGGGDYGSMMSQAERAAQKAELIRQSKKQRSKLKARGPGTVWGSSFTGKSHARKREIIQQPWHYPMAAQNLAAIEIQKTTRGFLARQLRERATAKAPAQAARRASMASVVKGQAKQQKKSPEESMKALREKFELQRLAKEEAVMQEEYEAEFSKWCSERVQAWWKMLLVNREYKMNRFSMYHIAAMQIQYLWRAHTREKYVEFSKPNARIVASVVIQRSWRSWTNVRIYKYFRDLIKFRNAGDPAVMLQSINPREAGLIDRASGLRVRFRLGGSTFPPTIYYKIFTSRPLVDMGAFAPRDYTRFKGVAPAQRHNKPTDAPYEGHGPDDERIMEATLDAGTGAVVRVGKSVYVARITPETAAVTTAAEAATGGDNALKGKGKGAYADLKTAGFVNAEDQDGWYRRFENNGWRPVSIKSLEEADKDPVAARSAAKQYIFHPMKLQRREQQMKQRKQRKREWLMKMYKQGLAKDRGLTPGQVDAEVAAQAEAEVAAIAQAAQAGHWSPEDQAAAMAQAQARVQAHLQRAEAAAAERKRDVDIDFDSADWEEQAEDLLQWSQTLDFDAYMDDWQAVGTSDHVLGVTSAIESPTSVSMHHAAMGMG